MSELESLREISDKYAKSQGFRLNPDKKIVDAILKGLLKNQKEKKFRYCPCRILSGNLKEDAKKICPCAYHKDEIKKDGHCLCNLFLRGD